jgi:hypothetical protein
VCVWGSSFRAEMKQSFVTCFLLSNIDLYDTLPKNVTFGSSLSDVRIVCKANTFKTSSHIELPLLPHLGKFIFASLFTFLTLKATPSNLPTFLQSLIFKHHTIHPPGHRKNVSRNNNLLPKMQRNLHAHHPLPPLRRLRNLHPLSPIPKSNH